jgi:hypothetical protein
MNERRREDEQTSGVQDVVNGSQYTIIIDIRSWLLLWTKKRQWKLPMGLKLLGYELKIIEEVHRILKAYMIKTSIAPARPIRID